MRKIALLLAALLFAAPAQAQQTKAAMTTEINTNFLDNTTGLITPAITRTTTIDMTNSWQQATQTRTITAASDTIVVGDYGHLLTYNNAGGVAVSIAQATGSFSTYNVWIKNIGAGNVTITPTISTINGAASIVVGLNEGLWIISDGTNYVTANLPTSINTMSLGQNGGASGQIVLRGNTSGATTMPVDATGNLSINSNNGNTNFGPGTGSGGFATFVGSTSGSSSFGVSTTGQALISSVDGSFSFGRGSAAGPTLFLNATTGTGSIGVTSTGHMFVNSADGALAIDAIVNSASLQLQGITSGVAFINAAATGGAITIAPGTLFLANTNNGIQNGFLGLRGSTSGEVDLAANTTGTAVTVTSSAGNATVALIGGTSGFTNLTATTTGGHLNYAGSGSSPTNSACTGFSLAGSSTDIAGRVTFTSATSCVINFGTAWQAAPFCLAAGNSAATTIDAISSTTQLTVQFGTAQTGMTWHCYGP